jgi:hypothetical protein
MWAMIKSKLVLYGIAVVGALLGVIKYLSFTRSVYKNRAKRSEAIIERQAKTQEIDSELDKEFKSHKAQIRDEIKEKKSVKSLEDPNDF